MYKRLTNFVLATLCLAFMVTLLGAYTRLKDAGLGCPDWPGCYGNLFVPSSDLEPAVIADKAWIEMIHRYVAGTLGILIFYIAYQAFRQKTTPQVKALSITLCALVVFQALLGMWTVTLRLYPLVVMGHLLGGFALLTLLWLTYLHLRGANKIGPARETTKIKLLALGATMVLLGQIALGGWTSANYAALVCADFPTCQGQWWPPLDWGKAFDLTAVGIFDSPGMPLENSARVTIQMAHRLGAVAASIFILLLIYQLCLSKNKLALRMAIVLLTLLSLQIVLGIVNVLAALPLPISLLHNANAALLLLGLIFVTYNIYATSNHRP
jgi:cytochrome c oxidase assembly protein subunit 15